jgi:hypothetical protein
MKHPQAKEEEAKSAMKGTMMSLAQRADGLCVSRLKAAPVAKPGLNISDCKIAVGCASHPRIARRFQG